ncbi:S-adenosyl-L-methionine-dependent methyltransferase, partial [Piptocephalis cylindrospora]
WSEGRRYQNIEHCPYLLPNDVTELNRLEIEHAIMRDIFEGIFVAPIQQLSPSRVLDVGCAQGTWVLEAASQFPKCQFTGFDISAVYPSDTMPTNCTFEFGNIIEGTKYGDGEFDYVHQRGFAFAVRLAEWPQVCRELVRVTAPRGVVEIVDTCLPFTGPGPATARINGWIDAACSQQGIEVRGYLGQVPRLLRQAGLSNIHVVTRKMPAGPWAGKVGQL